jgi:hypothetical protein
MEVFDEIRKNINAQKEQEFEKYEVNYELTNNKINKEMDINKISYDVNKFTAKIGKLQYLNEMKGKTMPNYDIGHDLLHCDINNENDRKGWTDLTSKEKKNKLNDFLDTVNLTKYMYEDIVKRRLYKKDIEFDVFTEKITSLHFLNLVNGEYVVTQKIKKKKKAKKLFK